jgi:prepilin-type N-terminal cleavage/methylation domain-containing protein/prepilin-type processing-associated H-X9-DG protein
MKRSGLFSGAGCEANRRAFFQASGFTLVELLVVIAIISLLMTTGSGWWLRSRDEAKAVVCKAQLRDRGIQLTEASLDLYNAASQPQGDGWKIIELDCGCKIRVPVAGQKQEIPVKLDGCPKAPRNPLYDSAKGNERKTLSYGMADLAKISFQGFKDHDRWLLACSDFESVSEFDEIAFARHRDSVNVFFFDGHVDRLSREKMPFPGKTDNQD